jgi:hypothetical protein
MSESKRVQELQAELLRQQHRMQTGVSYSVGWSQETSPKHLRVGINSAMVEHAALVKLLIKEELIDEVQYYEALIAAMKEEADEYEREISQRLGAKITLG